MSDDRTGTEELNLQQDFPPVPTQRWEAAILRDLKGADYEKELVWRTDEEISVRPYYRSDALDGLEAQTSALPGQFPFVRGTGKSWEIHHAADVPHDAVRADLVLEAGGHSVQQLAMAVAEGVEKLANLSETRPVDVAARDVQFVFAVGSAYFLEIAKLRAARMLWAFTVQQFNPADLASCRMNLHVRTARLTKSFCDPHTNLLRATTEAMSAAIGGCDSLSVQPFGFDEHIATNIQHLLAEEAHLNVVADPAGGSYYVETLTASLAFQAWKLFQRIEAAGGYTASIRAGWPAKEIADSRSVQEEAVSSRRRILVGVNKYPNLTEKGLSKETNASLGDSPFPQFRLAEPFEAIRERTARHAEKTGHTPSILLLTRGDLKMRTARANFSLNFFGCSGMAITQSERYLDSGADLIVLCSSDPEYLPFAKEVCSLVSVPVIVAGYPKHQIQALEAIGVEGFVDGEIDAVKTLSELQDRLGVAK